MCCAPSRASAADPFRQLSHRADSRIGSATIRGISGGERRRLTIALEMTLGHAVMLMDSPTNGLDSSSAMDLVDIARNLCDHAGRSALMALVQVSPDLFARFDHVLCMSHGALIYFGPVSDALPYMESLGCGRRLDAGPIGRCLITRVPLPRYRKPSQRTTPDFLSDICAHPMEHFVGNVMRPNPFAGRMGDRQYFPSIVADLFCDRMRGRWSRALRWCPPNGNARRWVGGGPVAGVSRVRHGRGSRPGALGATAAVAVPGPSTRQGGPGYATGGVESHGVKVQLVARRTGSTVEMIRRGLPDTSNAGVCGRSSRRA